MLKIYTTQACYSCDKAIAWAKEQGIPYEEIDLISAPLTKDDFMTLLSLTDNGVDDIISTRSNAYKELRNKLHHVHMDELLDLMVEYRTLLRRPLITDGHKLQVGYNVDDIRRFLPQKTRKISREMMIENIMQRDTDNEKIS